MGVPPPIPHHIYKCPSASKPFLENNTSVSKFYYLFSFDLTNLIYLLSLSFNFFWINSWIIIICSLHSRVALEITTYFNELFSPKVNYFISIFSYNTSVGLHQWLFNIFLSLCLSILYIYICIYVSYITEHYYYWFLMLIFIYIYQ